MRIGNLNFCAYLQERVTTPDDMGGEEVVYRTVRAVYISARPVTGTEEVKHAKQTSRISHLVETWYSSGIKEDQRLVFGATVLQVHATYDPTGKRHKLIAECEEVR